MCTPRHAAESSGFELSEPSHYLRLPEIIDLIARKGHCLCWNESQTWYEVVNGPSLEENLRYFQVKSRDDTHDRPFARMHMHFILLRGDRWGATGSAFRPKLNLPQMVDASFGIEVMQPHDPKHPLAISPRSCPSGLPSCFRSVLTEANPKPPYSEIPVAPKRYRPSDDPRMADVVPPPATRGDCPYPMAGSFSDALASRTPPAPSLHDAVDKPMMDCDPAAGDSDPGRPPTHQQVASSVRLAPSMFLPSHSNAPHRPPVQHTHCLIPHLVRPLSPRAGAGRAGQPGQGGGGGGRARLRRRRRRGGPPPVDLRRHRPQPRPRRRNRHGRRYRHGRRGRWWGEEVPAAAGAGGHAGQGGAGAAVGRRPPPVRGAARPRAAACPPRAAGCAVAASCPLPPPTPPPSLSPSLSLPLPQVLDGQLFEERFNALRFKRGKRRSGFRLTA
jgi:hypothetical protein